MRSEKYCLAIETTGANLGLSIQKMVGEPESPPLQTHYAPAGHRQSELLIPTLQRMMKARRIEKKSLGLIAVDIGPGSFTGVRIGLAAARTLAQALNVPITGVSSLEAMAWPVALRRPEGTIVSSIPALPGELYYAVYKPAWRGREINMKTAVKPRWRKAAELESYLRKKRNEAVTVVIESWSEELSGMAKVHQAFRWIVSPPHPHALAGVAMRRCGNHPSGKRFFYEKVVPLYLQPSWAERRKNAGPAR